MSSRVKAVLQRLKRPPLFHIAISAFFFIATFTTAFVSFLEIPPPAKAIRPPNSAYSLAFDGIDDFVEVPDSPGLRLKDELTMECWVELRSRPPTNSYLILGKPGRWWLEGYPGGVVGIVCWVSVDRVRVRTDFVQIPLDAFVHIVATYRGGELRAYLNGRLISSKTGIGGRLDPSDGVDVRMGNEFPATEAFWGTFDGMIDEARVYDRALARAEILENRRGNVTTDGLVAWWGFDEGSGGVAGDLSPYHNNGTIHGPTWHRFPGPAEAYLEEARGFLGGVNRYLGVLCTDEVALTLSALGFSFLFMGLPWAVADFLSRRSVRFRGFLGRAFPRLVGAYFGEDPSRVPILIFIAGLVVTALVYLHDQALANGILAYFLWFLGVGILGQFVRLARR